MSPIIGTTIATNGQLFEPLGRLKIPDVDFVHALKEGYEFFSWVDPSICKKLKKIIRGLLRKSNNLRVENEELREENMRLVECKKKLELENSVWQMKLKSNKKTKIWLLVGFDDGDEIALEFLDKYDRMSTLKKETTLSSIVSSITTNLVANANYKFQKILFATYSPSIVPIFRPPAVLDMKHPSDLKPNITSNSLMLAVEHLSLSRTKTRDYSVISTEGGSFKVVHENLPNFSMLRAQTYDDVLASCNKWMFLECKAGSEPPYELLWNPTTYEVRPLPVFAWPPCDRVCLCYGWSCRGIGFDPSSEDYKVIRFGHMENCDHEAQAVLFSLKTGSWKLILNPHFPNFDEKHIVHINGITYWIASRLGSEYRCLSGKDDSRERSRCCFV
ncbi:F-box protein [Striga asiatica]|uniref:F-box protein n=1 Tax=Striga asiatica TaxID=4170 RepID=A0A5A7NWF7_STRAF|nr:F-box protein [Striga asiatica]